MIEVDERFMRRALELAAHGRGNTSPNPMVGAVIVSDDGRIIGEGYHRRCGEAHAEVNAVASVKDVAELTRSTMYVTLEPCSHYGKTPPCARLIIEKGIPRVVVGAVDPCDKVCGRGIAMLREAGVEVVSGVLANESRRLNMRFMTAHEQHRPFVTLKWAQSADGYMDYAREEGQAAARLSTDLTQTAVHRLRSLHDAILVGSGTVIADDPLLDVRCWCGRAPRPVVLDRRRRVGAQFRLMSREPIVLSEEDSVAGVLDSLYRQGITSVLVEGGAQVLQSFIDSELWDVARVETSDRVFGASGRVSAPRIAARLIDFRRIDGNSVCVYSRNDLADVKNL